MNIYSVMKENGDKKFFLEKQDITKLAVDGQYLVLTESKIPLNEINKTEHKVLLENIKDFLAKVAYNQGLQVISGFKGNSIPWSRSLEYGETAYILDCTLRESKVIESPEFSECLWMNFKHGLQRNDHSVEAASNSEWIVI